MATKTVTITRTLNAPIERVWDVWTKPEHLKKWWGPKDFTAPHITSDFREGGKFLYAMHGPAGSEFDKDMWSGGTFKEIIPLKKIVSSDYFTDEKGNKISPAEYGMADDDWADEMLVTVTFEDIGSDKTKLTIVHEGHPEKFADDANTGWNQSLDKFATVVHERRG